MENFQIAIIARPTKDTVDFEHEGVLYTFLIESEMLSQSNIELSRILDIEVERQFHYESFYGYEVEYEENEITLDMLNTECIEFLIREYFHESVCYQTEMPEELESLAEASPELYGRYLPQPESELERA